MSAGLRRAISGKGLRVWIPVGAILVALVAMLSVDTYPVVSNDSIAYLSHSQDFGEYGFVYSGYRQFGYPLWLAFWYWAGSLVEPFALTSLAQRAALFLVTAFAIWKVRGSGFVLVGLALVPTFVAYTNPLLTESLAIPLAALAAVLVALLLGGPGRSSEGGARPGYVIALAAVAVALAMIRFHYVVLAAILFAVLGIVWLRSPTRRRLVVVTGLVSVLLMGTAFLFMAFENNREYGDFFPSVGGERVQFWTLWQVVVEPERDLFESELPDIFTDGNPYTFMYQVDALPYEDVKAGYAEATDRILAVAETTIWEERAKAAKAVFVGGRIDDFSRVIEITAEDVLPGDLDRLMHRNNYAVENGVEGFNADFNEGRVTRAGLISSGAIPQLPLPLVADVFSWLVPISTLVLLAGLGVRRARWKALAGLSILALYVAVAGWFILDNFRFLLPAYLTVVVLGGSVLTDIWAQWGPRRAGLLAGAETASR